VSSAPAAARPAPTSTRPLGRFPSPDGVPAGVRRGRVRFITAVILLAVAIAVSILVAVTIGPADLSVAQVWRIIADHLGGPSSGESVLRDNIVWELRLPRVLVAAVVGAGLGVIGAVMQTLTRNPLADPYLLGISSGASLGAVLVVVVGVGGAVTLPAGAFIGSMVAFTLVLLVGQRSGRLHPTRMVLAGVAIGQLCGAAMTIIILWVNQPQATQSVMFWLSGSLSGARWSSVGLAAVVLLGVLALCIWHATSLDAFAFGEDAAAALGIDVDRLRWTLLVASALLTGTMVSVSGAIGFVGLILPHAVRFVVGPHHHRVLPLVALVGAVFLIWVDTAARNVLAPRELPVGALTAVLGVPAFVMLMRRREIRA
jgi:iron complex transport system permease protein